MEYIKKLANDETWDCATFSGMCRFVANGNYYELPKPIEELAENHNFSVYDAPTEDTETPAFCEKSVFMSRDDIRLFASVYPDKSASIFVATMLPIETEYDELEDKMDDFLNVIEDALGLESDSISSSGWSFGIDDTSFDRLLAPKEQKLVSLP